MRRLRSNTPLQALAALNETVFVECAQALARITLTSGGKSDSERPMLHFQIRKLGRPLDPKQFLPGL